MTDIASSFVDPYPGKVMAENVMSEHNRSSDVDIVKTYCSEFREQVSAAADHILQTYIPEQDVTYGDCGDKDISEAVRVDGYGDDTKITVYERSAAFPLIRACAVYLLRKYLPQIPERVPNSTITLNNDDLYFVARGDLIYALSRTLMAVSGISKDVYTSILDTDTETILDDLRSICDKDLKSNN